RKICPCRASLIPLASSKRPRRVAISRCSQSAVGAPCGHTSPMISAMVWRRSAAPSSKPCNEEPKHGRSCRGQEQPSADTDTGASGAALHLGHFWCRRRSDKATPDACHLQSVKGEVALGEIRDHRRRPHTKIGRGLSR